MCHFFHCENMAASNSVVYNIEGGVMAERNAACGYNAFAPGDLLSVARRGQQRARQARWGRGAAPFARAANLLM